MDHRLRVYLFDLPDVADVGRAKELVGSPLSPAEETPLMVAHEAFPREHRVHFVPDDLLGEIEPRRLQSGRVILDVRVAFDPYKGQFSRPNSNLP